MDKKEWLKWRKNGVCASDAPVLYGKSKWRTIEELYEDKISDEVQDTPSNFIQQKGVDLEPILRQRFAAIYGICKSDISVDDFKPALYVHPKYDFIRASLDGISEDKQTIIEIKYVGQKVLESGVVPPAYYIQIQHQYLASGAKEAFCVMGSARDGSDMKAIPVERDDAFINSHIILCEQFWQSVQARKAPPPEVAIVRHAGAISLSKIYESLKNQVDTLSDQMEMIRNQLIEYAVHDKNKIGNLHITKAISKGLINYKDIPELKNVDLEAYRTEPRVSYRITIDEPKHEVKL